MSKILFSFMLKIISYLAQILCEKLKFTVDIKVCFTENTISIFIFNVRISEIKDEDR